MKKTRCALAVALTVLLVVSAIPFTAVDVFAANGVESYLSVPTPVYTATARNYCSNSNGQNYRNTVNLLIGNVTSGNEVWWNNGELSDYQTSSPVYLKSSKLFNSAELQVDPSRASTLSNVLNYGIYLCLDTFSVHSKKGIVRWGIELWSGHSSSPRGVLGDSYRSVTVTSSTGKSRTYALSKADGSDLQSAETGNGSMTRDSACASSTDLSFGPYYWYLKGPILDNGETVQIDVSGICVTTAGDNNYQMLTQGTHLTIKGVCSHSAGSYASVTSPATCTSPGTTTYYCNTCGAVTNTVADPPAQGHDFSSQTVSQAYLKSAATCTSPAVYYYKCSRCAERGTATYTYGSALNHDFSSQTVSPAYLKSNATCTSPAIYYYKCSRCAERGTATYTYGSELGHRYSLTGWSWSADHTSATATFTCQNDSSHVETVTDSVIDVTTVSAHGCETDYVVNYTASVVFGGVTYTDTVNNVKIADRTGHRYSLTGWTWNADHTSAPATFTCQNDSSHVETVTDSVIDVTTVSAQGCESDYVVKYTASVVFEGVTYTDTTDNVTLDEATGHDYELTGWTWNSDHTSATATFTCGNDASHVETVTDNDIEITTVSELGCESNYVVKYTASVVFEGVTYTDTTDNVTLEEATGHDYELTCWTWNSDHTSATATFTCGNDSTHVETATDDDIDITTVSEQGCETDYVVDYTASVDFGGATYTDTVNNVKLADRTGHTPKVSVDENFVLPGCETEGTHDEVVYCAVCTAEISRVQKTDDPLGHEFSVFVETVAPTCVDGGYTVYKCSRCDATENRDFTAVSTVHPWGEWQPNGDGTHSRVCSLSEDHVQSGACTFGGWTSDLAGHLLRTCSVCG
ncbi:MAG: hypothetical protein IJM45_10510 [Clostridia bacterium]|nr:hypothetical protein [Clostridia bacterium]